MDVVRNTFGILALLAISSFMTGACETTVENTSAPTEVQTVATPASTRGIGVSRSEMQSELEGDPFGFTFDPPLLVNGPPIVLGYLVEEGQEGLVVLIGPPGNLTQITIMTPITGAYSRAGLSRLTELASRAISQGKRGQGTDADAWVMDHVLLTVEEGTQSTRFDDVCMEMEWLDDLQVMTLVLERCSS